MRRRLRFVVAVLGWLVLLILGMAIFGHPRTDFVIVGGTLGLLALSELAAPVSIQPQWQRRLRVVRITAVLLTVAVIAPRVYDLIVF
ncbi:hypothetical protein [Halococcus saccharolyticus]|uniref:Uncharacterized protein n=1 Tax=Halococcus saccharolyticus DSM 5350 TaxID=1227455 RepID=M0MRJ3_9EURY|nr:hypothetical protein [Halococcus saccharolyticus]EMA47060.1 hypothetical protein C449_02627 [Halococcus saccharolyticus DSM 5350]